MGRVLFTTLGSLGDLHPLVAIALRLRERGHTVAFSTSLLYRKKLETSGFEFYPLRPDISPDRPDMLQRSREIMDARKGPERLLRDFIFPQVRETHEDLARAVGNGKPDLLVSGEIVYAAPLVAEKTGIRWVSCITAPLSFFSAHDPPILAPAQRLSRLLFRFGLRFNQWLIDLIKLRTRGWSGPVRRLRTELGLPPGPDPIYEGKHSPSLVLALFSSAFARKQPDWPPQTQVIGFPFYDGAAEAAPNPALENFLAAGEAPLVFTLGSAAVFDPRQFYGESVRAAQLLGRRALLLLGPNAPPPDLPPNILALDYAPYSQVFPRAAVVVHQGGIGTTAQCLRAGVPMLVMPFSFDQPDNAHRLVKLGVARTLSRASYSSRRAAAELVHLLREELYRRNIREIARTLRDEDGAATGADAIEEQLRRPPPG